MPNCNNDVGAVTATVIIMIMKIDDDCGGALPNERSVSGAENF